MGKRLIAAALGLALGTAVPATAAVLDYSSFHVLGDSLSDTGNVYRSTFKRIPESPPYYKGRFSNGPVWADRVADQFRDAGLPTSNQAWGGAKARASGADVPDLGAQATRLRTLNASRVGDRPLVAIWIGGNDILDAAGGPGAEKAGRRAAAAVGDTVQGLYRTGMRDFVILNLPDLGKIPDFAGEPDDGRRATRGSDAFNTALNREIRELRSDGAQITKANISVFFDAMLANPRRFGVLNTTTPCLDDEDRPCTARQGQLRAFFDSIHPNRVIHRRVSEIALRAIGDASAAQIAAASAVPSSVAAAVPAPVPLPASGLLLGGALVGLGLVSYQRRQRVPRSAPSPVSAAIPRPYQAT